MACEGLDSFLVLLNKISYELTKKNLDSLIYICKVPGSLQREMVNGIAVFQYLMRTNHISKEKVWRLREILKNMRPKRRDILEMVDDYIKEEAIDSETTTKINESEETDLLSSVHRENRPAFSIQCGEFHCLCRTIPVCFYVVIILSLIASILIFSVFWFERSSRDRNTGIVVVAVMSLILAAVVLYLACAIYSRRPERYDRIRGQYQSTSYSSERVGMATSNVSFSSTANKPASLVGSASLASKVC